MKAWTLGAGLGLLACSDPAPTPPVAVGSGATRPVVLAYQNNVNGDIEPCG